MKILAFTFRGYFATTTNKARARGCWDACASHCAVQGGAPLLQAACHRVAPPPARWTC